MVSIKDNTLQIWNLLKENLKFLYQLVPPVLEKNLLN